MAMTIEQVRDWAAKTPASNGWQAKERDDAVAALSAHLTQPAQAVDVGAGWNALLAEAKRLFLRQMAERQPGIDWSDRFHKLSADTRLEWIMQAADSLMPTRALAGEKAEGHERSDVWVVQDETGQPVHCAAWPEACHEHINDAINEHGIEEAKVWKVLHYTNGVSQ